MKNSYIAWGMIPGYWYGMLFLHIFDHLREKTEEVVPEKMIVFSQLRNCKICFVGQRGASGHPAKNTLNTFYAGIRFKPVVNDKKGKKCFYLIGQYEVITDQYFIHIDDILGQWMLGKHTPFAGKKMIIKNIDYHSGVTPESPFKVHFAPLYHRMLVSKAIDFPVQDDAFMYKGGIILIVFTLDIVADKIAYFNLIGIS